MDGRMTDSLGTTNNDSFHLQADDRRVCHDRDALLRVVQGVSWQNTVGEEGCRLLFYLASSYGNRVGHTNDMNIILFST